MKSVKNREKGIFHSLIELFHDVFVHLGANVSLPELEDIIVTVHKAMTLQTRNYHNIEHVFLFMDPAKPIPCLAGLYHDIVYYQVDKGLLPEIEKLIYSYIFDKNGMLHVSDKIPESDRLVHLTMQVFGFHLGQELSFSYGLNEFMSALVMVKRLENLVEERHLIKAVACIEATIPFRGRDATGKTPFDILENRLKITCSKYHTPCDYDEIQDTVKIAVQFSNQDVQSFADKDVRKFLDITWKLLPETNVALRMQGVYSVREYRHGIQKMFTFLSNLNPNIIFNQYQHVPEDKEYALMVERAHHNVHTAREYLQVKLVDLAILEALAAVTGGDAPISLFMGDIRRGENLTIGMEDFLPVIDVPDYIDQTSDVYTLLAAGRANDSNFDLKNSPLALFVYKSLTADQLSELLTQAQGMFQGKINPEEFLSCVDDSLLSGVAQACAEMVFTRRKSLSKYIKKTKSIL